MNKQDKKKRTKKVLKDIGNLFNDIIYCLLMTGNFIIFAFFMMVWYELGFESSRFMLLLVGTSFFTTITIVCIWYEVGKRLE